MPLYLVYTMVQKSQKWPKTQIKGGSCLKLNTILSGLCLRKRDLVLGNAACVVTGDSSAASSFFGIAKKKMTAFNNELGVSFVSLVGGVER